MKEKRFYLVAFIASYVYLKEKYENINEGLKNESSEDIEKVLSILQPLEKFLTIPDKKGIVKKSFDELSHICRDGFEGQESAFLSKVREYAKDLSDDERQEIVNIVIYVTDEDGKISEKEKEVIVQVAHALDSEDDFSILMKKYKKSSLKRGSATLGVVSFAIAMLLMVGGFAFYVLKQKDSDVVKVFSDKKVVFNQISFNRFVIYQNKANVDSKLFKKQAVFYIAGDAEVSFDPKDVTYDPNTNTVTYLLPRNAPFRVEVNQLKPLLVDEIQPKPLNEKQAAALAVGIGVAGGIIGAKAGGSLGSLYPDPLGKIGGSVIGGALGGIGTGLVAFNTFNGMQLSKEIGRKEKAEVADKSVMLIETILTYNSELTQGYREAFVKYIKAKYAVHGKVVTTVNFDEKRIGK